MASAEKKLASLDAATVALWRVAESGDVEELSALLPRVGNVNACNQHGMTALMRAAQHGRVRMVRALLEHGADANVKRNDKFIALSLAAFFGHTEVGRTSMQHGADSRAATRGGTSPQMWATARTFKEVAHQLEQPEAPVALKPLPSKLPSSRQLSIVKPQPVVEQTPASAVVSTTPLVVRTLKDPPEIWDLVHEQPRGFDPRTAFLTRLQSIKTGFAFRAATAVVLIAMCTVGVLVMRKVQARGEKSVEAEPVTVAQPHILSEPAVTTVPATAPATRVEPVTTPEVAKPVVTNEGSIAATKFNSRARVVSSNRVAGNEPRVATNEVVQPVATPSEKSEPPVRIEATAKPRPSAPLSPQLITPAKGSAPK